MNRFLVAIILGMGLCSQMVFSEETNEEKVQVQTKDIKRSLKKTYHKIEEKTCLKSDKKCLKEKNKHRRMEQIQKLEDEISELKGKLD